MAEPSAKRIKTGNGDDGADQKSGGAEKPRFQPNYDHKVILEKRAAISSAAKRMLYLPCNVASEHF